jgi:glycosyltransferase involved in cell wall biosynthesis
MVNDMELKVVGDGPLRSELEIRVGKEGTNVTFLGMLPRRNLLTIVEKAKCNLFPRNGMKDSNGNSGSIRLWHTVIASRMEVLMR